MIGGKEIKKVGIGNDRVSILIVGEVWDRVKDCGERGIVVREFVVRERKGRMDMGR